MGIITKTMGKGNAILGSIMTALARANDARRNFMAAIFAAMTVFAWGAIDEVFAASGGNTLGGRAAALKDDLQNVYDLILVIAMLVGVVLAIVGIIKMTKSSREEGGMAKAIVFIAAGALLIAIPALIMYTSGSILGTGGVDESVWK